MWSLWKSSVSTLLVVVGAFAAVFGVAVGDANAESKIVFAAGDQNREIFVMNADGSNVTQLTNNEPDNVYDNSASMSPDGSQIAFIRFDNNAVVKRDIYVMDADGSNVTNLTNGGVQIIGEGEEIHLSWSPELPPSVAAISPLSQTVGVFFLGVIAALLVTRRNAQQAA